MSKDNSEYLTEAKKTYDRLLTKTVDPSAKDGGRKTSDKYTQFDGWIPLNNGHGFTFPSIQTQELIRENKIIIMGGNL